MKFLDLTTRQGILIVGTWNTDPIISFGSISTNGLKYVRILNDHMYATDTVAVSSSNVVELPWTAWSYIAVYSNSEITVG